MKKKKVRTENAPQKKRALKKLSRDEMRRVRGGVKKKPKKKTPYGISIAAEHVPDHVDLPFTP